MTLAKRAAIAGSTSLILVGLAFSRAMVGFLVLSGRLHEVSFVVIGVVTNVVVYGLLAERVMWLWGKRGRKAHKTGVTTASGM